MKQKSRYKYAIVITGFVGALLVLGATIATLYGDKLMGGSYSPRNPLQSTILPDTQRTPDPACTLNLMEKEYLLRSIDNLSWEISYLQAQINRIHREENNNSTTPKRRLILDTQKQRIIARINQLLEIKSGREQELRVLLEQLHPCEEPPI